jgi:hypothetical protein
MELVPRAAPTDKKTRAQIEATDGNAVTEFARARAATDSDFSPSCYRYSYEDIAHQVNPRAPFGAHWHHAKPNWTLSIFKLSLPARQARRCMSCMSSHGEPSPMSTGLVVTMAAACGFAIATLYYIQPLLPLIGDTFGVGDQTASVIVTLGRAFRIFA